MIQQQQSSEAVYAREFPIEIPASLKSVLERDYYLIKENCKVSVYLVYFSLEYFIVLFYYALLSKEIRLFNSTNRNIYCIINISVTTEKRAWYCVIGTAPA